MAAENPYSQERKKCIRYDEIGHAHALTFSCFKRLQLLSKDRSRLWLADAINGAANKHAFDVWAYVFMPEHVHLLICPRRKTYAIQEILFAIKFPVAKKAISFLRRSAPDFLEKLLDRQPNGKTNYRFWQRGGGYDRNVTEPKTLLNEIRYIHANPVTRKLTTKEADWEWSSAADYHLGRSGPIPITFESLPFDLSHF